VPSPELVYLDLNHWVGLSKARLGRSDAGPYVEALSELRIAVAEGRIVVPLKSTHYMEISRIASAQRRADLALTMGELSRYVTLTQRETLLRYQFRTSLAHELGTVYNAPAPAATGRGFAHAFGQQGGIGLRGPDPDRWAADHSEEFMARLEEHAEFGWTFVPSGRASTALERVNEAMDAYAQFRMLMGPTDKREPELLNLGFNPQSAYDVVDAITRREADLSEQLAADPKWLLRLHDIIDARALYWDLREEWDQAVNDVWARVIAMDEFGQDRLSRILRGIPIIDIESAIRRANFRGGSHKWTKNDIHDADFAGSAVSYCQVVLTEKHLSGQLRREGLDRKYETVILARPEELTAHLRQSRPGHPGRPT
jgi:hypothetical protein